MGFFDKFKSANRPEDDNERKMNWHHLNSMDQLDGIVEESKLKPVAIFKHSTRCGVSRGGLKTFEKEYDYSDDLIKAYFLDLLAYREISNEIAARFGVHHESPQLIVIQNGNVVYHDSHHSIAVSDLDKLVGK